MSIRRVIPPVAMALLLCMACAVRADMSVKFAAETASLFIFEPFTVRLEVDSETAPETPELPTVPDLAVTTMRRLASEPEQRKHVFQIELIAERDGILTIPPFVVRAGDESISTSALRLRVDAPRPATEMTLDVAVEPTTLRVGQPATVTVTWTSSVSFARCKQLLFEFPLLVDARCHVFPLEPPTPESEWVGLPVNNMRVVAQSDVLPDGRYALTCRYQLVPREPCVLRSHPARFLCALLEEAPPAGGSPSYFYNHFFEVARDDEAFEEVYLAASVPELTVKDLVETGRSERFSDIVGPCTVRTSVTPNRLTVGQPALLTVHLDNLEFARHIDRLPSAAFDGLRCEFQLSRQPIRENLTDNTRSFTHVLRPLRPRITRIPAVVVQVFDPESDQYRTVRSEPIPIAVDEDPDSDVREYAPRTDAEPPIPAHGIRHNRSRQRGMTVLYNLLGFLGRFWWLFVILPPLVWLALRPLAQRWERCRHDPMYARAIAAWRRFSRNVRQDEEQAWRDYLADRLGLCADALTADTVTQALRTRNVDSQLISETRRRFEEKDAVDYGRRAVQPSQVTLSLVRRLQKATVPLLLLATLIIPTDVDGAEDADRFFAGAMQMRAEKPDEAQPLFIEAALRFESAGQFLNAGNSWFFAGENGRALANFRAAERRAPFDRQLRESIAFVRSSRADAFPPPATPAGTLAAWWAQYCTWAPGLRIGLFVTAYLLAWAVFISARLGGRRVPWAVWVMLLGLVLVPLASLVQSSLQHAEGVVVEDLEARLGPGYAYDSAFRQPLHKAAEFTWLETRQGWVHARFSDGSEGWLRESGCVQVR